MKQTKTGQGGGRIRLVYLIVISLLSRTIVYGRLNVNVALNRPTYMVSTYYNVGLGGYFSSSKAVDGNKDTNAQKVNHSCAHTLYFQGHPWWAVDLGRPICVTGVLFTNRANGYGYQSDNFVIGLTNMSPDTTAPSLWNYDVCGQWPGVVGDGATVYMKCQKDMPFRRYLVVQMPITNEWLNFCEIEVYIRSWEWRQETGQRMVSNVANIYQVTHRLLCINNCVMSPVCDSFNYRPADKTCQLNTHDTPLIANSADIVANNQWEWWRPEFTTVV